MFVMDTGEGRVHQCLRDNLEKLSDSCRKEELALRSTQSSNVELMPNLAQACAPERAKHCADVRPGKARVFMCLLNKSDRVSPSDQAVGVLHVTKLCPMHLQDMTLFAQGPTPPCPSMPWQLQLLMPLYLVPATMALTSELPEGTMMLNLESQ